MDLRSERVENEIVYRYGTDADLPRIKELIVAGDLDGSDLIPGNVLLAEAGGAIVGINRIKYYADGAAEIASAYVIPQYRGRGINETLTRILAERESGTVFVITSRRNTEYIGKMGFRPLPEGYSIPASIREKIEWCRVRYNPPPPGPGVFYRGAAGK